MKEAYMTKQELTQRYQELQEFCEHNTLTEFIEYIGIKLRDLEDPLRLMIVGEGKSGISSQPVFGSILIIQNIG